MRRGDRAPLLPVALLLTWFVLGGAPDAEAHKASDSYLSIEADGARSDRDHLALVARWDIALADLDDLLVLDDDGDGTLRRGELDAHEGEVLSYARGGLSLGVDGVPCAMTTSPLETVSHSDGGYAVVRAQLRCPRGDASSRLVLRYGLLFERDRSHRGLLRVGRASWVLSPAASTADLTAALAFAPLSSDASQVATRTGPARADRAVVAYVGEGLRHIAGGADHLLFLLALLLPAGVRRVPGSGDDGRARRPVTLASPPWREVLTDVCRVVTAFTLAHSLTLALATLGWVRLPGRLVESAIAASVVLAALDNLVPLFGRRRWAVAFALGLLHGFGFSAALGALGLHGGAFALALFGFNAGVELGQLALVALLLPLAFAFRETRAYQRGALGGGSLAIGLVASLWFVERAFALPLSSSLSLSLPFLLRS